MTQLSYGPLRKENNKWENVGFVYILSMTNHAWGGSSPPCHGPGQRPRNFFWCLFSGGRTHPWFCAWVCTWFWGMMVFGPWYFVDPVKGTTVMFWSRVNGLGFMYASACIYMCCDLKRNTMKNQASHPGLGSRGKSLCISILCFMLSLFFIFCL